MTDVVVHLQEQNKLLEQKNKALSDQLDKITEDLFKLQEVAADLKNQLEEKKHTEQLAGWAIDRATKVYELGEKAEQYTLEHNTVEILKSAARMTEWIMETSAKEKA